MKSVLIVTDAWHPQVNGVVRSLERVTEVMQQRGLVVHYLTPQGFLTIPMPGYGEIRLSITTSRRVFGMIKAFRPDSIHIATEGPLGVIARRYCIRHGIPFATSYHTQFPEYLRARVPVPVGWSYRYLRRFHSAARYCLVPTESIARRLEGFGFTNTVVWSRGVDLDLFTPQWRQPTIGGVDLKRPVFLYVGRVAVEKNVELFLKLDLPGTKVIVGDGPSRKSLQNRYRDVVFAGVRTGEELARYYASADCFVFPSQTDTFGLVLLEALASGTPVAALPVTGPLDVIGDAPVGVLDTDLRAAALRALDIPRPACREYAARFSWTASANTFIDHLPPIDWALTRA